MSSEALHNAIRSRFKTEVADKNAGLVVIYDNAPDPDKDALWVRFTVLEGDANQQSLGPPRKFRTVGVAVGQVFALVDTGDRKALQVADKIKLAFRAISAGGVTYRTPSVKNVGRVDRWWQVNVTCPFYADETEGT